MTKPELPYENDVKFATEPMQAIRDSSEVCQENDVVQVFETPNKTLLAVALGFRNFGMYIGLVMSFGAPIGFGKVLYVINNTAFVNYSTYPLPPVEIQNGHNDNEESFFISTD